MRPRTRVARGLAAVGGLGPLVLLLGCGVTTQVRPVARGTWGVEAAAGGPLVRLYGIVLPVPLSSAGVRYGVAKRADVAAHVHLTSLTFGLAGVDVGGSWLAVEQAGAVPAVSVGGRLYGFAQVLPGRDASPRAYLELSPAVSYLFAERFLSYASASGLVQFAGGRPLLSLALGEEVRLASSWGLCLEARWYEPQALTRFHAVDWVNVGERGALGVMLGARYHFGGGP